MTFLRYYSVRLRRSRRLPYRIARVVVAIVLPIAVLLIVLASRR
jgi:hypothetical protein